VRGMKAARGGHWSSGEADAPVRRAFRVESRPLISAHPRRFGEWGGYVSCPTRQSLAAWAKLSGHFPHPRGYAGQRNARRRGPFWFGCYMAWDKAAAPRHESLGTQDGHKMHRKAQKGEKG
jgi:hypothetical protein